jgi:hypothetical protein
MGIRKCFSGPSGEIWERKVAKDLTDALEDWLKAVPDHRMPNFCSSYQGSSHRAAVRWEPHLANDLFFHQSAFLHESYYLVQMAVFQKFLLTKNQERPLFVPSVKTCTDAAKACAMVFHAHLSRKGIAILM